MKMEFEKFRDIIKAHFEEMAQDGKLFVVDDGSNDTIYEKYLSFFKPKYNPIIRVKTDHDCSACRHFIKRMGKVVAIKDGKLISIWDVNVGDDCYQPVADAMAAYVKQFPIKDVFLTKDYQIGVMKDYDNDGIAYTHYYTRTPNTFLYNGRDTIDSVLSDKRAIRNVFKRSLDELTEESVLTVLELIAQKSLYRGEEWNSTLKKFLEYKKEYSKLSSDTEKELYAWDKFSEAGPVCGKIRNHSIGTLLIDISEDVDLDVAVRKYEAVVAPANYKRPNAIFTKKMLEDAKNTIAELGYMDSLAHRYATLDDITINDILFSNKDSAPRIKGTANVFDDLMADVKTTPKKFSKTEKVSIEDFINNVLPTATEVEAYVENKHTPNFVSLIAPVNPDAPSILKWENNFGWAYSGNVTDSLMKERVEAAGGNVTGDLRFSIQWNENEKNFDDLDAHCIESTGYEIYFGNARRLSRNGGVLDVDIINPNNGVPAVENITYASRSSMTDGKYLFFVNQYNSRGGRDNFRAEIEFDGHIYHYDAKNLRWGERYKIKVATITLKNGQFSIEHHIECRESSKDIWGVKTNTFVPVKVICNSPNYWSGSGVGNKHYFFMLKGCVNDENPNAFYNEYLKSDLAKHKRVFEALGSKMHVEDHDDQLSGLGFSSTKRAELTVKVKGATERVMTIVF